MSRVLTLQNRQRTRSVKLRSLRQRVLTLLAKLGIAEYHLGIRLVDASQMTALNEGFLRHRGSTDVITFNYLENDLNHGPRTSPSAAASRALMSQKLFGDIIVCVDEAVAQAKRYRATWQAELSRYIVHGVLHLLGYDDSTAVARQRMRRQENRLMKTVSVRHSLGKSIRAGLRNRER